MAFPSHVTADEFIESSWGNDVVSTLETLVPLGAVIMFGGSAAPAQWQFCRGQAISRSTFSALYAIIGTSYGAGDGTLTFNLPNYQASLPVGYNSGVNPPAGVGLAFSSGPGERFGYTNATLPSHQHGPGSLSAVAVGTHWHQPSNAGDFVVSGGPVGGPPQGWKGPAAISNVNGDKYGLVGGSGDAGAHGHSVSGATDWVGADATNANYPPCQSINYLIRVLAS